MPNADRPDPGVRRHCVISGTGRAGTSFLVQLLTHLGLDTGYTINDLTLHKHARAGLERDVRAPDAPYIVKSPWFCDYAEEVFARPDIQIDQILVPMRDLFAAAESRRFVVRNAAEALPAAERDSLDGSTVAGGLWHTTDGTRQELVLLSQLYRLMLAASATDASITLLRFPLLTEDPKYLFSKLEPIIGDITFEGFRSTFDTVVKPDWVHKFGTGDST